MSAVGTSESSAAPISVFIDATVACASTRADTLGFVRDVPHRIAKHPEDADVALISSCAFSEEMQGESLRNVKTIMPRLRPGTLVVVSGCLAAIDPSALKREFDVEVVPPGHAHEFLSLLGGAAARDSSFQGFSNQQRESLDVMARWRTRVSGPEVPISVKVATLLMVWLNRLGVVEYAGRWRPFHHISAIPGVNERVWEVVISQGCVGRCTFCAIPLAKGRTRSAPLGYVISSVREAVEKGAKDIVLNSEDIGAYGIDNGTTIIDLLDRLQKLPGEFRLHLTCFDPRWLGKHGDGLLGHLKDGHIRSLQLPLQSASDRVLRLMARGYTMGHVLPVIEKIRTEAPHVTLTTQMIAGFPGETPEDHQQSLDLVRSMLIHLTESFPFSVRPNTKAKELPNHVDQDEVLRRAREFVPSRGLVRS